MMSVERELLIGAVEWMHELKYVYADARDSGDRVLLELIADINKIEKLLNHPEQEPVAWSDEEIKALYDRHAFAMESDEYMWGFRDAEKAHGITGVKGNE
jgi:hypothetical protein